MLVVSDPALPAVATSFSADKTLVPFLSCFNCTAGFALPPAVSNIQDLIAACASELPPPPAARQNASALDATNVSVLPSSAWASRGSKEAFGIVEVPMLDCSNPKCGCPKGKCTCMNGCCGAEVRVSILC